MKVKRLNENHSYLSHEDPLFKYANFRTDHAYFSKLGLIKCIILLEKQHFRNFRIIRNESKLIQKKKKHFLSDTTYISVILSQISEQSDHSHFSKLRSLKCVILV